MSELHSHFSNAPRNLRIVALSGGIGGAKLALGLYHYLDSNRLAVVCNPGDDFEHLGLTIWPDFDTVLYTLAGINDRNKGWGIADETWSFMSMLGQLGGPDWFQLGDRDLAMHVERTQHLNSGKSPFAFASRVSEKLGVKAKLLVCAEQPIRTIVQTTTGVLGFQEYFVRDKCVPEIKGFEFRGAKSAVANPQILEALSASDLDGIVICPSNPFISVDPILAIPSIRQALLSSVAPVVAVSPIVAGKALKGPTAKMMAELGVEVSARQVAKHYGEILDGFIVDSADTGLATDFGLPTRTCATIMNTLDDRVQLAHEVCDFLCELRDGRA